MKKETKIHFFCEICWLPGVREKALYSPRKEFLHLSQFTSDFSQAFSVGVYFDDKPIEGKLTCNRAQLVFLSPVTIEDYNKLNKLANKAELILIDGNIIKAVCRNLEFVGDKNLTFGENFQS